MRPFQHTRSFRWKEGRARAAEFPSHRRWHPFLVVFLLLVLVKPCLSQQADDLFDASVVEELRLYIHPDDWSQLRAHYLQNTWYLADLCWRGLTAANIGIRSRGSGSRSNVKPGLTVRFNKYVDQQFLGLTELVLDNSLQDPSFLRERLSMLLFRRMGIAAPREAYARLYVNDEYFGLYSMVEAIDRQFLARSFGEDGGALHEYRWMEPQFYFESPGDDWERFARARFEPRTSQDDSGLETIGQMVRVMNEASDGEFVERASGFLDLKHFLKQVAVENYLADADGLLGLWGMNNFYLYRFVGTTRFQFIPWDKDVTFGNPGQSIWFNVDSNVLTRRALAQREVSESYLDALQQTAKEAEGWLERELEHAYLQIQTAVYEDSRKPVDNEQFERAVAEVRNFVRLREACVLDAIERARRQ
jgi:spore coat protein H